MKKFILTLLNDILPKRFTTDDGKSKPHKCSKEGCKHWAKYYWTEETMIVFKGKRYSEQKYGCYYHTPKIFSLGLP